MKKLIVLRPEATNASNRVSKRITRTCLAILLFPLLSLFTLLSRPVQSSELTGAIELGPHYFDRELYAGVFPSFYYDSADLTLEVSAPVLLRLKRSKNSGMVRSEDWDSLSDAGRVLKKLELSLRERELVLKMGALAHLTLGHGTIINDFTNSLLPDIQPVGAHGRVVTGVVASDALVANLLGRGVLAAAVSVDPTSIFRRSDDKIHLLFQVASDLERLPSASPKTPVFVGVSADYNLLQAEQLILVPYADINTTGAGGYGLHLGALVDFSAAPINFSMKLEWRVTGGAYQPEYFDIAYSLERASSIVPPRNDSQESAPGSDGADGAGLDKQTAKLNSVGASKTWRAELRSQFQDVAITATLSSRGRNPFDGSLVNDSSIVTSIRLKGLDLAAVILARQFHWGHNPARLILLAEGRQRIDSYLHLWANAGRLYRVEGSGSPESPAAVTQLGCGIGGAFGF